MSLPRPTKSDSYVWVPYEDPQVGEIAKQVHISEANEDEIIRCTECGKPARVLDGLYPYHQEMNHCVEHTSTKITQNLLNEGDNKSEHTIKNHGGWLW